MYVRMKHELEYWIHELINSANESELISSLKCMYLVDRHNPWNENKYSDSSTTQSHKQSKSTYCICDTSTTHCSCAVSFFRTMDMELCSVKDLNHLFLFMSTTGFHMGSSASPFDRQRRSHSFVCTVFPHDVSSMRHISVAMAFFKTGHRSHRIHCQKINRHKH